MSTSWLTFNPPRLSNQVQILTRELQRTTQELGAAVQDLLGDNQVITPWQAETPPPPPAPLSLPRRTRLHVRQGRMLQRVQQVPQALSAAEAQYQQWVHDHVDPLFGRERYEQLRAYTDGKAENLSPVQHHANRMLLWGTTGALISGLAAVAGVPIGPFSLGFGLLLLAPAFPLAYQRAFVEHRLSFIHLGIIYGLGLYSSGYLAVGAVTLLTAAAAFKLIAQSEASLRQQIVTIFGTQPRTVWQLIDDVETEVPFAQVQRGDYLIFDAGQTIPVDGTVVTGAAAVDQHMLTGEAQPAEKGPGDRVLAATLILSGRLVVEVNAAGDATTAAQISTILNQSSTHRLSIEDKALNLADHALPAVLVGSGAALILQGPLSALAMIGSNYTLNMVGAIPFTLLRYLNHCTHMGILVKDGEALERLPQVDTVIFDKTGTLTLSKPHVAAIHACPAYTEHEVLLLAATAEQRQSHPIAQAILAAAAAQQLNLPAMNEASYEVGYGLKVQLPSATGAIEQILVGSERFMHLEGLSLPADLAPTIDQSQTRGNALVWVARDGVILGAIELMATVRPEAQTLVQTLQARGIQCYIISGDQEAPTQWLAHELGVHGAFANRLPQQKAEIVAKLKADGRTICFVGDGINDTLAFKSAHVSVSLAGAASAATDTAQVVLMGSDLRQLLQLVLLVDAMDANLKQNFNALLALSLTAASGVLLLGAGFITVELLYAASILTSIAITMQPLPALPEPPTQALTRIAPATTTA